MTQPRDDRAHKRLPMAGAVVIGLMALVPILFVIVYPVLTGMTPSPYDFMLYYVIPLVLLSIPLSVYVAWKLYKEQKRKERARTSLTTRGGTP